MAPTIAGGSQKHGGPDLGLTRARQVWTGLGGNGCGVADQAPGPEAPADHRPKLTMRMVAESRDTATSGSSLSSQRVEVLGHYFTDRERNRWEAASWYAVEAGSRASRSLRGAAYVGVPVSCA